MHALRDFPLPVTDFPRRLPRALTAVLLHVARSSSSTGTCTCQLPPYRLPRSFDFALQLRGPVRPLFGGIDAVSGQLLFQLMALLQSTTPSNRYSPVSAANTQAFSLNCSTLPLPSSVSVAGGHLVAFKIGAQRQRIISRFTAEVQLKFFDLILRRTRPAATVSSLLSLSSTGKPASAS
jgi:hypothetical protein